MSRCLRPFAAPLWVSVCLAALLGACSNPAQQPADEAPAFGTPMPADEWFYEPVVVQRFEVQRTGPADQPAYFLRVYAELGAQGVVPLRPSSLDHLAYLRQEVFPALVGKDIRDLRAATDAIALPADPGRRVALAHVECVLLDLLGMVAGRPAMSYFAPLLRKEVEVLLDLPDTSAAPGAYLDTLAAQLRGSDIQYLMLDLRPAARQTPDFLMQARAQFPAPYRFLLRGPADTAALRIAGLPQPDDTALVWLDMLALGGPSRLVDTLRSLAPDTRLGVVAYPGPQQAMALQVAAFLPTTPAFVAYQPDDQLAGRYVPMLRPVLGRLPVPAGAGWGLGYDTRLWIEAQVMP
ncbi:MAG: hypothetical protein OHK0039_33120 [Bacteroidia bacterium]